MDRISGGYLVLVLPHPILFCDFSLPFEVSTRLLSTTNIIAHALQFGMLRFFSLGPWRDACEFCGPPLYRPVDRLVSWLVGRLVGCVYSYDTSPQAFRRLALGTLKGFEASKTGMVFARTGFGRLLYSAVHCYERYRCSLYPKEGMTQQQ